VPKRNPGLFYYRECGCFASFFLQ